MLIGLGGLALSGSVFGVFGGVPLLGWHVWWRVMPCCCSVLFLAWLL
jgi:hypothetical protein